MRIEQLEHVAAIAKLGSFRQAAEELHLSQPALSASVRNLERELGISLFARGRGGAQVSDEGRALLPVIGAAIEAVDGVRSAAGARRRTSRTVRLRTVTAGTAAVVVPAITAFRRARQATQVEVISAQEAEIDTALREGRIDLGIITALEDDDSPPDLETTVLIHGHALVCVPRDNPLAALDEVRADVLVGQPLIVMRPGYLMHRVIHRLLDGDPVPSAYVADGAEMGKLLVAEGAGVTVLPDFSVIGDPLHQAGMIVAVRLVQRLPVLLAVRRDRMAVSSQAAADLHALLLAHGQAYERHEREPDRSGPVAQRAVL